MKIIVTLVLLLMGAFAYSQQGIDRKALVRRHTILIGKADTLSSLSVGNGRFAFTVDVTGLQTFPGDYAGGVPLGTESEWGWHSFADTAGYRREEALKTYSINGRDITYAVEMKSPERKRAAANWFRQNPHRLQLGNLGFEIRMADGSAARLDDIKNISQQLDLWTGEIRSHFTVDNISVTVSTFCDQRLDVISASIQSELIAMGRLKIALRLPYPTGEWADVGTNYQHAGGHLSSIQASDDSGATILHRLDTTEYFIGLSWRAATIAEDGKHHFIITPAAAAGTFAFSCRFSPIPPGSAIPDYASVKAGNEKHWERFWTGGAAVDLSGSTDKRAMELERRIVLSQYLIRIQETGSDPPQETGLTYNSWFGKPHMEMPYWHLAHYPFWGRAELLDKSMDWYFRTADKARALARRQGFDGLRWPKVTDNNGDESPSSVGAFLIWDEPHLIYFAEILYRDAKDISVLDKYKDLVFGTADFMASFPFYQQEKDRYILGKGLIPAQERFKAEETFNPSYELVYWKWALDIAQQWRERLHLPRNKKYDDVLQKLSRLPVRDNRYLAAESATDSYTNPEYRTDHPSVLMALGVMPATGQVDTTVMRNTFDWIWTNWSWKNTWGWDFPMVAMTAARLRMPEKAVDALLMDVQTNTYLVNGHNYQNGRLRIYLPGNGGLLTAIAMMSAGWDGAPDRPAPGFPDNGKWKVKWEGLRRVP